MKRKTLNAALSAVLALGLVGPAAAEGVTVLYADQGEGLFSFEAPDAWTLRSGFETPPSALPDGDVPAPRIITLMPEDDDSDMWAGLWSPPGVSTLEEGAEYYASLKDGMLDTAKVTSRETREIGGAKALVLHGEATRLERDLLFDAAVIELPGGRVAAAMFIGAPEMREMHAEALREVLESIRAAEGAKR